MATAAQDASIRNSERFPAGTYGAQVLLVVWKPHLITANRHPEDSSAIFPDTGGAHQVPG